jgi:hypothetical protein
MERNCFVFVILGVNTHKQKTKQKQKANQKKKKKQNKQTKQKQQTSTQIGCREWKGKFADNDAAWTPSLIKQLNVVFEDDGTFWMNTQDFFRGNEL